MGYEVGECSSSIGGVPVEKQHKKKSLNPSQLRRSQARIKTFIEKKEQEKQRVEEEQAVLEISCSAFKDS